MCRQHCPSVHDLADALLGKFPTLLTPGDTGQIRNHHLQRRRNRPVTVCLWSMTTGTEALIELWPGIAQQRIEFSGMYGRTRSKQQYGSGDENTMQGNSPDAGRT